MKVNELDEGAIRDIGHAFGYYDYGGEQGLASFFPSQEATSLYIQGYVRGMLRGVFLHSTGPRNEGFIAYKLPGQKIGWRTVKPLAGGMLRSLGLSGVLRLARAMKRGGPAATRRGSPIFLWGSSASGRNSRGRATCAGSWTLPSLRGTGWASR